MGLMLRRRAGNDMEGYFLAGRKMPGWLNGCSYAATCLNADVAPAYCGMTVITGAFICWWYLSRFGLALMIGGVLFAVLWRRLSIMTSPEFYELRFSGTPAVAIRTWVALRSAFVAVVAWTGAGLLGMHKVAQPMLGWDLWTTFAVVVPIILFYVLLSGYVGVVISDFFQTLVIIGASLTLMWAVLADFGGPAGLHDALVRAFGDGRRQLASADAPRAPRRARRRRVDDRHGRGIRRRRGADVGRDGRAAHPLVPQCDAKPRRCTSGRR